MEQIKKALTKIGADYKPFPFWSWNDKLDPEELKRQIRWMHESGIGGFFMHARSGLETGYLSEEWLHCIEECCKEAEALGMNSWAYDENGWPSGFAGGTLLAEEENRDMYIEHTEGSYDPGADVSYCMDGDALVRVESGDSGKLFMNLYLKRAASTADILNAGVVRKFIDATHEKYKAHFGEDFSKKIKGFFTDEPQYYRWNTPYTPMVREYFREVYGEELLDRLGLLFVEKEGWRELRYRYWLSLQKLMLNNFAKQIYDWCDENGVMLTGHYVEERNLAGQLMCCAGVMPFYEYEHIPGIDWLGTESDSELGPRQLGSAARQLGKKQVMTESFAGCGWDVTPADLVRLAGFQYACGINLLCHHLLPYSERGMRKTDWPAHFSAVNPWVETKFKDFNDYFTRLGYLLAEGEEPVNVAMLHPIRSSYFDYKRDDECVCNSLQAQDEALLASCRLFSSRGIQYHFLDETLMETHGFVKADTIGCGKCAYKYLVIPEMQTMGAHTEALLRKFAENGGRILLLAGLPQWLEGRKHDYHWLCSTVTFDEILQDQPFLYENTDTELYCTYRIFDGKPFIYLQNASDTKSFTQTFRFRDNFRSFAALDPVSLETKSMPLTVTVNENQGLILFPVCEEADAALQLPERSFRFENAAVSFGHNLMTLDQISWSRDGETWSAPILRQALFQELLEERYEGPIRLRYSFTVEELPEKMLLLAEKQGDAECFVNGLPFSFSAPYPVEPALWVGDVTGLLRVGENAFETQLSWHQSEETYYALFGENVTESLKNCIVYESELADVYLAGSFGVRGDFEEEGRIVTGHSFAVCKAPEAVTEPVLDGLPFFRGKLTLKQTITLEDPRVLLKLEGRWLLADVRVNGKDAGTLLFGRRLDLSTVAHAGENELEVTFTLGNRNLLGPFHAVNSERTCLGPDAYTASDLPCAEGGSIRYKFYRFYAE